MMAARRALRLALVVGSVHGLCHNNCHRRGLCTPDGTCDCFTGAAPVSQATPFHTLRIMYV